MKLRPQEKGKPCVLMEIIALSRKRIEMRIRIARMEALGCLAWLSVSATSPGYEECPLTYDDLHYLKVKLVPRHQHGQEVQSIHLCFGCHN